MFRNKCIFLSESPVFILPLLIALWRMADQLITETSSSGILSRTDVCHEHLVLVTRPRSPRQLAVGRKKSSGLFSLCVRTGLAGDGRNPPVTEQPGAGLLGGKITTLLGQIYFQRGTKKCTHRFDDVTLCARSPACASQGTGYQWKCSILVSLGTDGEPRQSHPEAQNKKGSLLWYCNQTPARCSGRSRLNSVIFRAAIKPRGSEKGRLERGTRYLLTSADCRISRHSKNLISTGLGSYSQYDVAM